MTRCTCGQYYIARSKPVFVTRCEVLGNKILLALAQFFTRDACVLGGRPDADQLYLEPGRLDRMGLPEDKQPLPALSWDDSGRARLPDVAPLRKGKSYFPSCMCRL